MRVLCFDIGGTGIKSRVFDESGRTLTDRIRVVTPHPATPIAVMRVLKGIAERSGRFDRVAAGFPGVVKEGSPLTAPNMGKGWKGFPLQHLLEKQLKVPARVSNDADAQGLGAAQGRGLELMITLGTGVGSGLIYQGILIPNLELGHHPFRKGETYEEQLGKAALEKIGIRRWSRRVHKMMRHLQESFSCDQLYLGGGHARHVMGPLPAHVRAVSNEAGLLGCLRLWAPRRDPVHMEGFLLMRG